MGIEGTGEAVGRDIIPRTSRPCKIPSISSSCPSLKLSYPKYCFNIWYLSISFLQIKSPPYPAASSFFPSVLFRYFRKFREISLQDSHNTHMTRHLRPQQKFDAFILSQICPVMQSKCAVYHVFFHPPLFTENLFPQKSCRCIHAFAFWDFLTSVCKFNDITGINYQFT